MSHFLLRQFSYKTSLKFSLITLLFISIISMPVTQAYAEVKPVPATEASNLVKLNTGSDAYTLVFVFASWCPVCRRNFPVLVEMAEHYRNNGMNVVAISADRSKSDLSDYIARFLPLPFTPYHAMQRFPGELRESLENSGIHYNGSIPFIALLDKEGNVVGQGNYSVASVAKALHNLLPVKK